MILEHYTCSHSIANFPDSFCGLFRGFGDRFKVHLCINQGQKTLNREDGPIGRELKAAEPVAAEPVAVKFGM